MPPKRKRGAKREVSTVKERQNKHKQLWKEQSAKARSKKGGPPPPPRVTVVDVDSPTPPRDPSAEHSDDGSEAAAQRDVSAASASAAELRPSAPLPTPPRRKRKRKRPPFISAADYIDKEAEAESGPSSGNMWAQQWNNIYSHTAPYPAVPTIDVTAEMKLQNYTARRMFDTAEAFYKSIGMFQMVDTFYNKSLIEKPTDGRKVVCYASSEDFFDGTFAIKMCTKITMEDLIVIHHEMGHVEYFMAYQNQHLKFRDGANAGFHEAIGDTMALSVATPSHLKQIGLLLDYQENGTQAMQQDMNFLFKQALEKIAFLPFGYLIDNYRWQVFDGRIPMDSLNDGWWFLRYKYQGVVPPVPRSEMDFDPGAKYHVADDVPYIRYFISFVIQFQFQKALCTAAGYSGPLHKCDIYKNKDAGTLLKNVLSLGSSRPWTEAMMMLTGSKTMDAAALMEYFAPLTEFLEKENRKAKDCFGWGYEWPSYYNLSMPRCPKDVPMPHQRVAEPVTPFDATIVWIGLGLLLIVIILMLVMGFLFWTRDRNTGNVSITPLILSPDGVSQDSNAKNSNY